MGTQELKNRLHRQIDTTDNDELLRWVSEVLDSANSAQGKYMLSESEEAALAERDVVKEPGNHYTTDQLEERLKKWLNK